MGEVFSTLNGYEVKDRFARESIDNINLQMSVTPKQFGAAGDGVRDDTAAFAAAASYVKQNGGGCICLTKGRYLISDTIDLTGAGIKLTSEPHYCVDILYTNPNKPFLTIGDGETNCNTVIIENLNIIYSGAQLSNSAAIVWDRCANVRMKDIIIQDFLSGMVVHHCTNSFFNTLNFVNTKLQTGGIALEVGDFSASSEFRNIQINYMYPNGDNIGIAITNGDINDLLFYNVDIANTRTGIRINGANAQMPQTDIAFYYLKYDAGMVAVELANCTNKSSIVFDGGWINCGAMDNPSYVGFNITNCDGVIITNYQFIGANDDLATKMQYVVCTDNCKNIMVKNNLFYRCLNALVSTAATNKNISFDGNMVKANEPGLAGAYIVLQNGQNMSVCGNTIDAVGAWGILIDACTNVICTNNIVNGDFSSGAISATGENIVNDNNIQANNN